MNYKSTEIGFSATLNNAPPSHETKSQIGFTARITNGFGDPTREPCIGFQAKLREVFNDPQMEFAFDAAPVSTPAAQKAKAGTPAPAF